MPKRRDGEGLVPLDSLGRPWAAGPPIDILGIETVTVSTAAIALTGIPDGADSVLLVAETQPCRLGFTGEVPAAGSGFPIRTTDPPLKLENLGYDQLFELRVIRSAGADSTLQVLYYRVRG